MRAVYALVLALGGVAAADDKAVPGALKAFEGECVLTGFDSKGVKFSRDELKKLPESRRDVVVTGNTITAEFGGKRESRAYKVDNAQTPHHIDFTFTRDGKAVTGFGIYKVEKGVVTICATEPGDAKDPPKEAKDRPTEFKTGRDTFVMTVRKRGELDGTYLLTGLEAKGVKLTDADLKKVPEAERRLVIDDDQIVSMFNAKEDAATFRVDDTKAPRHITLVTAKDNRAETNYGIYKFEKGTLTLCVSEKGEAKDRPADFKADGKTVLFTLQIQPRK